MRQLLHIEPADVQNRLAELGLSEEQVLDSVRQGYVAFISCTQNHPRLAPGFWAWAETVRALRDQLIPLGWDRSDKLNYPLVIHPLGQIAIAVATGDEATGDPNAEPSTNSAKGVSTTNAVNVNQQLLFSDPVPAIQSEPSDLRDAKSTWYLLIRRSGDEVRCELSLPSSIRDDGYIDSWMERIILGRIPIDGEFVEIVTPPAPDITIEVQRRA